MSTWFEGSSVVAADPRRIASDLESYGEHCAAVLRFMPGITSAELAADDGDAIRITTNEGTMRRTNIRMERGADRTSIEFDEVYGADGKVTVSSHYRHEFVESDAGCEHRLSIRDVQAPGLPGWLYRKFGSRNIGQAVLASYEKYYRSGDWE